MLTARPIFALAALVFALAVPASASAQNWACNDQFDTMQLQTPSSHFVCSCFCTFECFGATMTADTDLTVQYIDFLYGAASPYNTFANISILQDPIPNVTPGTPFVDGLGQESVLEFFPMQATGSQFYRVEVAASGIQPPTIPAGDDFSITVCFAFDEEEGADSFRPGDGHGPVLDSNGVQSINWVNAFIPTTTEEILDGCGSDQSTYSWRTNPGLSGDFVMRVTDTALDWLQFDGCGGNTGDDDDDATAADDDDVTADDDDVTADDDDDTPLVVLGVSPNATDEGVEVPIAITGQGFEFAAQVLIGKFAATNPTFVADTRIDAIAPSVIPPGTYAVTVRLPSGAENSLPGAFTVRDPDDGDSNNDRAGGCGCGVATSASPVFALIFLPLLVRRRR